MYHMKNMQKDEKKGERINWGLIYALSISHSILFPRHSFKFFKKKK